MIAWATLALIASFAVGRTLLAPDPISKHDASIVPDFAVNSDVRSLQGTSSLDAIEKLPNGATRLTGWIFDERTHRPATAMYLDIDGTTRIDGIYREPRPDVAAAFHLEVLTGVGFHVVIPPAALPPGQHRLRIGIRVDGDRFESVRRYALRSEP